MSYSRSSARSDLKTFTFPLASYNFRMRAICDVSDIRTFLRLMLMAHSGLRLMLMAHYPGGAIMHLKSNFLSVFDLVFRRRVGSGAPTGEQRGVFSGFFFAAEMASASNEIDLGVG